MKSLVTYATSTFVLAVFFTVACSSDDESGSDHLGENSTVLCGDSIDNDDDGLADCDDQECDQFPQCNPGAAGTDTGDPVPNDDTGSVDDTNSGPGIDTDDSLPKEGMAAVYCMKMIECDSPILAAVGGEAECPVVLYEFLFTDCPDTAYNGATAYACAVTINDLTCDEFNAFIETGPVTDPSCSQICAR